MSLKIYFKVHFVSCVKSNRKGTYGKRKTKVRDVCKSHPNLWFWQAKFQIPFFSLLYFISSMCAHILIVTSHLLNLCKICQQFYSFRTSKSGIKKFLSLLERSHNRLIQKHSCLWRSFISSWRWKKPQPTTIYSLWRVDPAQQPIWLLTHLLPPLGAGQRREWEEQKQENSGVKFSKQLLKEKGELKK